MCPTYYFHFLLCTKASSMESSDDVVPTDCFLPSATTHIVFLIYPDGVSTSRFQHIFILFLFSPLSLFLSLFITRLLGLSPAQLAPVTLDLYMSFVHFMMCRSLWLKRGDRLYRRHACIHFTAHFSFLKALGRYFHSSKTSKCIKYFHCRLKIKFIFY